MNPRDRQVEINKVKTRLRDLETDILITLFDQRDNLPELEAEILELRQKRDDLYKIKPGRQVS